MFKKHPIEEGKNNILTGRQEHELFLRPQNDSGKESLGASANTHPPIDQQSGDFISDNA
jgi:hypothetical protein